MKIFHALGAAAAMVALADASFLGDATALGLSTALFGGLNLPYKLFGTSRLCRKDANRNELECKASDGCAWNAKKQRCRSAGWTGLWKSYQDKNKKCGLFYDTHKECQGDSACYWNEGKCHARILNWFRNTRHNMNAIKTQENREKWFLSEYGIDITKLGEASPQAAANEEPSDTDKRAENAVEAEAVSPPPVRSSRFNRNRVLEPAGEYDGEEQPSITAPSTPVAGTGPAYEGEFSKPIARGRGRVGSAKYTGINSAGVNYFKPVTKAQSEFTAEKPAGRQTQARHVTNSGVNRNQPVVKPHWTAFYAKNVQARQRANRPGDVYGPKRGN